MKKTTEHYFCDLCGEEHTTIYQKFECSSHITGYDPIEAVGIKIVLVPFGPAIKDVCLNCYQKALDAMLRTRLMEQKIIL